MFTQHYLSFILSFMLLLFLSPKNQPMYFLMLIAVVIFLCIFSFAICCCSYQFSFSSTKSLFLLFPPKMLVFLNILISFFCKSDTNPIYPDCFSTFFFLLCISMFFYVPVKLFLTCFFGVLLHSFFCYLPYSFTYCC